jgi:glutamate-1-semialdehyde 2,1-aminomutase
MKCGRSDQLYREALKLLPGGVDSPVRAFKAVGGTPLFMHQGDGAYLTDVDGNRFVDLVLSWGPLILGHAHPSVVTAIKRAAARGTSFGAPCEAELELARLIRRFMPHMEMMRFVNSGTEATMSALRLARAATGRDRILKFEGCYHGHEDALLVRAGSGLATLGLPDSPGVPDMLASLTVVAHYNDLESVAAAFTRLPGEIAAVIVEPVAGNMGVVPPAPGFLRGLRQITEAEGALLIFDEVMTGFRVHPSGASALYGVKPDLTTLGKVIGGGLPVGAYGGLAELMALVAPSGAVYQAGTLSGNPLAMAAGVATLSELSHAGAWESIEAATTMVAASVTSAAGEAGIPVQSNRVGTMFSIFFTEEPVRDWATVRRSNTEQYASFFRGMLEQGVYCAPSPFEAAFVSSAHRAAEIQQIADAARRTFDQMTGTRRRRPQSRRTSEEF